MNYNQDGPPITAPQPSLGHHPPQSQTQPLSQPPRGSAPLAAPGHRSSDPLNAYNFPAEWPNRVSQDSASQYMARNRQNHHVSLPPMYYNQAGQYTGPNGVHSVPRGVSGPISGAVGNGQLSRPVSGQLPGPVPSQVPNQVPSQVSNQVPGQLPSQLPSQLPNQMQGPISGPISGPMPGPMPLQSQAQLPNQAPIGFTNPPPPNSLNKTRRAKPDGGFLSPLAALTTHLSSTYQICDPRFEWNQEKNPRRVLTEPSEPVSNNRFDNADNDYILYVNDILGADDNRRYLALNLLGKGTFGQVVKCQNMATMEIVAVKVIKNKPAFLNQSMMEVSILEYIQQSVDQQDEHNLVRLRDKFTHKEHLCLVFDLLSSNLYEVIKKNKFRGLGLNVVRSFATQLLDSLLVLKGSHLIHCDLKPENILLRRPDSLQITVIDFGSACHERQTVYTYIQSRFYRSPEVILGLPYTSAIDMWSLGCIIAELFLGLPVFPGSSEYNQWCRIVESLGMPPAWMLDMGKNTNNCMVKLGPGQWAIRTLEEQNRLFNGGEKEGKKYFASPDIHQTIMSYPLPRNNMTPGEISEELKERESLSDFVRGLLNFNPFERWTPQQAQMHPFISRQRYFGPYYPGVPGQQGQGQGQAQGQPITQPMVQPQVANTQLGGMPLPPQVLVQPPQTQTLPFPQTQPAQPLPPPQFQQRYRRVDTRTHRGRAATIGQVSKTVPAPIQQAAALVDPNDVIQGHNSPAYFPPQGFYQP